MKRLSQLIKRVRRRFKLRQAIPQTLASLDAYALWAATYPPIAHNRLMQVEQAAMLDLLPPLADRDVLDLACGSGRYTQIARDRSARRVIGLDNSVPMLRVGLQAGVTVQNGAPSLAQGEMDALPFAADTFDVLICALAIGHLPPTRMLATFIEIARVLRPGGAALISDFHPFLYLSGGRRTFNAPNGVTYAVEHTPHLISDYYAALRSAGLTLERLSEPAAVPDLHSATLHSAAAPAVLILLARKPLSD